MNVMEQKMPLWLRTPVVTRKRVMVAMSVAVVADGIQAFFGMFFPPGWIVDDLVDVIAMFLTATALGFHPLLLPTFILKLVPYEQMLPTWTACTALVAVLRRRDQAKGQPQPPVVLPPKSLPASCGAADERG
jgi:hypothetical protein